MTSKPLMIREEIYNKLRSMKNGDRDSFTDVLEHLCSQNEALKDENLKLLKEKLRHFEAAEKKV